LTIMAALVDEYAFYVQCTGQIESGNFGSLDNLYCRYSFCFGHDWEITSGLDTGLSQTARKNTIETIDEVVWNFPIDVTYQPKLFCIKIWCTKDCLYPPPQIIPCT
jgi:hypothetical protein